jgi:2-hydroxy-3-keto-5-methylthiopentenyl-1-phosphate phosphatase
MPLNINTGGKPFTIVFDFDGTITEEDIFDGLFARYADPECWETHRAYHDREISLKEAYLGMAAHFRGSQEDIYCFLREEARLRDGFRELHERLTADGARSMIVSNGFDIYLEYLVRLWNLGFSEEDIICHHAEIRGDKFIPIFREHEKLCHDNCLIGKAEIIRELQQKGAFVAFAGNGYSDTPAAHVADLVFGRQRLEEYCREEEIPFVPFSTFTEVENYLFTNSALN